MATEESFPNMQGCAALLEIAMRWPMGSRMFVPHDGFEGTIIGYYLTHEGKSGLVLQLINARVVHVYGENWCKHV